ncbi:DUF1476 domain-containing protein [Niveispirillum irakense]|uniref:DUF1476 domain-containing protein n=1 Tax=Niveispirillum irakense TaxID=34011 RepID=UPI0003F8E0E3|nr:DUF1476 domain-containing protein [Niveispirillum irakense]
MTTFDDREQAFENKFKHDEEVMFRIQARRAKLIGIWAAEQMGITGDDAEAYGKQMVAVDFEEPGHKDIVRKILADFKAKGVDISEHRLEKQMDVMLETARQQIQQG